MSNIRNGARHGLAGAVLAFALVAALGMFAAPMAHAVEGDELPDVMLGVFTNSENDVTDSIYMSADGVNFELISTAYPDMDPWNPDEDRSSISWTDGRTWDIYPHVCPSIIYHNGYFWMLSNESYGDNGQLRLMMSNSKDLVHWSDPTRVLVNVEQGWQTNGNGSQFDAVAADWAVGPDGCVYVAVSIGYYGAFHGNPENDTMYPYVVKITELSSNNDPAVNAKVFSPTVRAETARYISLPTPSSNRIDGSWYFEGNTAFLSIKKDGVHNEIWAIDMNNMGNAGNLNYWSLVSSGFALGCEGPSLTKLNDTYYMFTDSIHSYWGTFGTYSQTSSWLWSAWWSDQSRLNAYTSSWQGMSHYYSGYNTDGPRHGTVITITDPAAKQVIWDLRAKAGWTTDLPGAVWKGIFNDVPRGAWYESAVELVNDRKIMTGYGDGTFGVGQELTRAQVASMMWKYADPVAANAGTLEPNKTGMSDVEGYQWYTAAMNWAYANGVLNGSDGRLRPSDSVTMEEIVAVIGNYVESSQGVSATGNTAVLDRFSDGGTVSPWFLERMAWAIESGLINGNTDGTLQPTGSIMRERTAAIFANALEKGIL